MRERRPWPRDPRYLVGEDGTIVGPSGRALRQFPGSRGYLLVSGARPVHVIVCETFHGPRPGGMEVAHEDGDKNNCSAANLSWKTRVDNHADKLRHGTLVRGSEHYHTHLTEQDVRDMRSAAEAGSSIRALATRYDVRPVTVYAILQRRNWRHVS